MYFQHKYNLYYTIREKKRFLTEHCLYMFAIYCKENELINMYHSEI